MLIHALPHVLFEHYGVLSKIVGVKYPPPAHRLRDNTIRTAASLLLDFSEELLDGGFLHGVPPIASSRGASIHG